MAVSNYQRQADFYVSSILCHIYRGKDLLLNDRNYIAIVVSSECFRKDLFLYLETFYIYHRAHARMIPNYHGEIVLVHGVTPLADSFAENLL